MITFEDKQNNSFKKKYVGVSQYVMHVCIYFSAYYLYPAYFQRDLRWVDLLDVAQMQYFIFGL